MLVNVPYCPMRIEIRDDKERISRKINVESLKKYFKFHQGDGTVEVKDISVRAYGDVYTPILSISRRFTNGDCSNYNGVYILTENGDEAVFSSGVYVPIATMKNEPTISQHDGVTYRLARNLSHLNALYFQKDSPMCNVVALANVISYTGWCYYLETMNHYYKVNGIVVYDRYPEDDSQRRYA